MRYFIFVFALIFLASCKKDNAGDDVLIDNGGVEVPPLYIWKPVVGGTPYSIEEVIVNTTNNYRYFFTDIRILTTNITAQTELKGSALFDFAKDHITIAELNNNPDMSSIGFNIGVPDSVNHLDPSTHPTNSALNISNASDMHWGWNPGYIFVKLEGRVDTTDNGIDDFNYAFAYHIGGDDLFKSLSSIVPIKVSGSENYYNNIELRKLFDDPLSPINLKDKSSTHSSPGDFQFASKLINNLVNAFE
ncbi:MAG: hypothetical protein ACI9XP_001085 [Lentimonas sp.]|jgi:hypothetical protein